MNPLRPDARLARRAAAGDERAFAAIFKRYSQDLYRFCLSIVGRPEDAQDALQNTMVKALRSLPGEEREIQLKPWLYRVAHNESIDLLRRRREGPPLESVAPALTPTLSETVERRERLGRLLADLEALPERQRSALVMRELGGLGYGQIAEAFESSDSVARQTVYEARLGLREMEAGREMDCDLVTRQISEADGRIARRRDIRAHLRSCADCRAFRDAIESRHTDLAALAPLPAVAAGAILQGLLGGGQGVAGAGAAGAAGSGAGAAGAGAGTTGAGVAGVGAGAGVGKAVTASVLVKSVATVAAVGAIGITAADRSGLVHTGLPGGRSESSSEAGSGGSAAGNGESRRAAGGAPKSSSGSKDKGRPGGKSGDGRNGSGEPRRGRDHNSRGARGRQTAAGTPASAAAHGELPSASRHGQETAASHGGGRAAAETKSQAGQAKSEKAAPTPAPDSGGETPKATNKRPENPPAQANPPDTAPAQPLQPSKAPTETGPPNGQGH
jgi:RNA polymerase sigma factor (sigma-70 family)